MRMNIENCLRHELPERLRWLGDQLVDHLKQLRDGFLAGNTEAIVDEFFDLYRFNDSQCADNWREIRPSPVQAGDNATETTDRG